MTREVIDDLTAETATWKSPFERYDVQEKDAHRLCNDIEQRHMLWKFM